jgi:surface antigen
LPTWSTPANNAIAVFKRGWPGYYSYGHVGVIVKIDREGRAFLMSEMNGPGGKGVVSHRWISMDDKNISGYIY